MRVPEETLNQAIGRRDQTWLESPATVTSLLPSSEVEQLVIFVFCI